METAGDRAGELNNQNKTTGTKRFVPALFWVGMPRCVIPDVSNIANNVKTCSLCPLAVKSKK